MVAPDLHSLGAMKYRADIDGLRALAVLPVVAFHFGLRDIAPGGYVGVDIFFVISGFLISRILVEDVRDRRFSLWRFYERRIRRIVPALFAVCAATLAVAALFLTPIDYRDLGQSAVAVTLFGSNILFYMKSGYFDHAAELKPLLHTWSLGVEEQYYIVWPLIVYALARLAPGWRFGIVLALFTASLAASIAVLTRDPSFAFYMLPTRAWELLAGSLVAMAPPLRLRAPRLEEGVAIAALALIIVPIGLYDSTTLFPGLAALPPVLGAALLLALDTDRPTATARGLSLAPLRFVGRISYSLYLWHWPVIVLYRYYRRGEATPMATIALLALTFTLATACYYWVERPFRTPGWMSRRIVFAGGGAAMTLVSAAGLTAALGDGLPGRLSPNVVALAAAERDFNPRRDECDRPRPADIVNGKLCRFGLPDASPTVALVGDSFSIALEPGIDDALVRQRLGGVWIVWSGCMPLPGVTQRNPACRPAADAALDYLVAHPELRTVFLVARWTAAVTGKRKGIVARDGILLTDDSSKLRTTAGNALVVTRAFRRLQAALPGRTIIVVGNIPEQPYDVPRELALRALRGETLDIGVSTAEHRERADLVSAALAASSSGARFHFIDLTSRICDAGVCRVRANGIVRYTDDNHLSRRFSRTLSDLYSVPPLGSSGH